VLTVQVDEARRGEIERILLDHGAVDAGDRGEAYRSSGWQQYDPTAPAYTPEEIARERGLYGRDDPRV
jgi:hypothetical protein